MGYGDFKDLNRKTIADKVLRNIAFNPNLGRLFKSSIWGGGDYPPACLKLVRIMPET